MLQTKQFKLDGHEYTHSYVEVTADVSTEGTFFKSFKFYSYRTMIINIELPNEAGLCTLTCTGTYSRTTAKQISWFLRPLYIDIDYFVLKALCNGENDAIVALDDYSRKRCTIVADWYWNNGSTMNMESYNRKVNEAINKWYW